MEAHLQFGNSLQSLLLYFFSVVEAGNIVCGCIMIGTSGQGCTYDWCQWVGLQW